MPAHTLSSASVRSMIGASSAAWCAGAVGCACMVGTSRTCLSSNPLDADDAPATPRGAASVGGESVYGGGGAEYGGGRCS